MLLECGHALFQIDGHYAALGPSPAGCFFLAALELAEKPALRLMPAAIGGA